MPKETMTSCERWLAVLNRQKPDRVPMDIWATPEAFDNVMKHTGCSTQEELFTLLHVDRPLEVFPEYIGPELADDIDMHAISYRTVSYEGGTYRECASHPLSEFGSVEEIEANYNWPTADWFDYSTIRDQVRGNETLPIRGGGSEPFLTYKMLRGDEQALMDLVVHPEIVHYCMGKMYDFCYENTRRIYEQVPGVVTITYVAEDLGGQEALMYSPGHIREFFLTHMRRMIDLVHEAGAFVIHHSDGAVRDILPDMIEIGIDVLNPIQWRCSGMEREGLKRDFGHNLIFHGGVDNQQTLPFGSVEDVQREVIENMTILGAGGGYILAPCHNIQPVSPPENVVALFEAGYRHGFIRF